MKKSSDPTGRRPRGRPRREDRRDISDALLDVTEHVLERDGFTAVTERKIASLAGVSEATIPYYFGDKDGLLFAVVDRFLAFIEVRLGALMEVDPASPTASMEFARALIEAYHTRPWLAHLMTAEQQRSRESLIWKRYLSRRGNRSLIQVRAALLHLAAARHGTLDVDEQFSTRIALSLLCVTTGTLSWYTLSESLGVGLADMQEEPWLQHMASLIDFHCYLLAGGDGAVLRQFSAVNALGTPLCRAPCPEGNQ